MSDSAAAQRIRAVFEMYEFGEQMYRAKLGREHPDATANEIEALIREWRMDRPGAPMGDAIGRLSTRFG